jgi:hypothetical protein
MPRRAIPKRFQDEQLQRQIAQRYQAGERRVDIAKTLGTKSETVTEILRQQGASLRRDASYQRKFTPDAEREIAARYSRGESLGALARVFGASFAGVSKIVRRQGVPTRPRGNTYRNLSPDEIATIVSLWEAGTPQVTIANELKMPRQVVSRTLRGEGIEPVPRHVRGDQHGHWKGGRIKTAAGYWYVKLAAKDPMYGMANTGGYVAEHRLVMARKLGRPLLPTETVHHIDGDRENNAEDNLQLRKSRHGIGQRFMCADCGSHNIIASAL